MPLEFLTDRHVWLTAFIAAEWVIRVAMLIVVPFRRSPDAAKGWLLLILFEPAIGLALYLVFGRRRIPEWRLERAAAFGELARPIYARLARHPNVFHPEQDPMVAPAVRLAEKLGDLPILGGNSIDVLSDYGEIVDRLVADIDGARSHVHLLFYIIADDAVAGRVVAALERAAARGVVCRVLGDALGSRGLGFDVLLAYDRDVCARLVDVQERYFRDGEWLDEKIWGAQPLYRQVGWNLARLFAPLL